MASSGFYQFSNKHASTIEKYADNTTDPSAAILHNRRNDRTKELNNKMFLDEGEGIFNNNRNIKNYSKDNHFLGTSWGVDEHEEVVDASLAVMNTCLPKKNQWIQTTRLP